MCTRLFNNLFKLEKISVLQCRFSSRTKLHDENVFGLYSVVKPALVTGRLSVPPFIDSPAYVNKSNSSYDAAPKEPEIKCQTDIEGMRKSCKIAKTILDSVKSFIEVGVTTDAIDKFAHNLCISHRAYPSPLGYMNFPKSICTSVNNVACHGIPDDRPLENGDIVNVDVTVYHGGYHGDCSATFPVGDIDEKGRHLIEATEQCLNEGIRICKKGEYFCNVGRIVTDCARKYGYNVVPCFAGHGIGRYFHGPPDIFHCYNDYPGQMQRGMTFTIEPVLTQGEADIIILEDGWTAVTADNSRTAQFEHTILIGEEGAEILTLLD